MSTLAILAGGPKDESRTGPQALSDFQRGVSDFVKHYGDGRQGPSGQGIRASGFDLDSKVQVFETVIRGVGGLLSAHLFAIGELPIAGYDPTPAEPSQHDDLLELPPIRWPNGFKYDGQLLRLALDLGQRLLPAFYTPTGIPYPRVNLRHGIPFYTNSPLHGPESAESYKDERGRREVTETCSAGAGSLTLEFTVLSRLTGDPRFEQAGKRAFWEVWGRKSHIGLIGNGIDAESGAWIGPHSGIGAGMDSFFEYALKSHILLSGQDMPNVSTPHRVSRTDWLDPNTLHPPLPHELHTSDAFLETWHRAHDSVKRYIYTDRSAYPYYSNNHRNTGQPYTMWIDSLGAFYPGLLALAGEVDEAIEANLVYTALWTRYSALPERWSFRGNDVDSGIGWWPGRPEFIESTYYIYRATKDPWYLYVGEMVLKDIKWRCYAPCGWAGLQDVRSGEKQDRMESFFLGETTKYMYLLFDPDHQLNKLDAPFVFTTEGHPLIIPKKRHAKSRTGSAPAGEKSVAPYTYFDDTYTNSCPVPKAPDMLMASATAARPDLFDVSRFTGLYNIPNIHGPLEAVQVQDKKKGRVTKYRPLSNHTLFPWTLPPQLLPPDGTCLAPPSRVISWIEFPASDPINSVISKFGTSLVWQDHRGPTVKNLGGLRLQIEKEAGGLDDEEEFWRITHVGPTELGKHESVFFHAEHVRHLADEAFTAYRDSSMVDIEFIIDVPSEEGDGDLLSRADDMAASNASTASVSQETELDSSESLFRSLLRVVSSVFEPSNTGLPETPSHDDAGPLVYSRRAYTATGLGGFPVPPIVDTPIADSPTYNNKDPISNFPWKTIYLAGYGCDGALPDTAPRNHQVIVMRRGRCSFSAKLDNIPSFSPSTSALQLVIVVNESDEEDVRPQLETEQLTPRGVRRPHGIPLVLMSAAAGDYELFRQAAGVGMRRKYHVKSQGGRIDNAIVL